MQIRYVLYCAATKYNLFEPLGLEITDLLYFSWEFYLGTELCVRHSRELHSCQSVVSIVVVRVTSFESRLTPLFVSWFYTSALEDVPLVELIHLVFTRMPGESCRRRLSSLLLCLCDVFRALMNSLVSRFFTSALRLVLFQIIMNLSEAVYLWVYMSSQFRDQ